LQGTTFTSVTLCLSNCSFWLIRIIGWDVGWASAKARDNFCLWLHCCLRVSDLFAIKVQGDIDYLNTARICRWKHQTVQSVLSITWPMRFQVSDFKITDKRKRRPIFPPDSSTRFNNQAQSGVLSCWVNRSPWKAYVANSEVSIFVSANKKGLSIFASAIWLSSHTMLRTAITTMLMLGLKIMF